jgi:tetratricopeptide (TPR) repeat protein
VSGSYYDSGLEAYNSMDYENAIKDLTKACQYDANNDEALYYLALAYYDSEDMTNASAKFSELLEKFPYSEEADKARQHLEEISE